tara:strand:+ start:301 stop:516 length:216 start_codon:yes stop_codon:yes gene_type:complete
MKYKNLNVLFKDNPDSEDDIQGTHKVTFTDAVMMVSGDHLVISEHNEEGTSITGRVFPLKSVDSYKAEPDL